MSSAYTYRMYYLYFVLWIVTNAVVRNPRRCYKFPFKESKFALWEAQLEKLKTTLNCLMNVLILAQALKEK